MSAHVLLNLFNELRKSVKMRGLLSILSLFRNEFNKFDNTGALMLDSIYHMALKLHLLRNVVMDIITLQTTSGLSILLLGVISLPCDEII